MFEGIKAQARDWADRVDQRLTGTSSNTNESASRHELSRMLGSPAAESQVNFGLEFADLKEAVQSDEA